MVSALHLRSRGEEKAREDEMHGPIGHARRAGAVAFLFVGLVGLPSTAGAEMRLRVTGLEASSSRGSRSSHDSDDDRSRRSSGSSGWSTPSTYAAPERRERSEPDRSPPTWSRVQPESWTTPREYEQRARPEPEDEPDPEYHLRGGVEPMHRIEPDDEDEVSDDEGEPSTEDQPPRGRRLHRRPGLGGGGADEIAEAGAMLTLGVDWYL
jgi:hypothetical protein